MIPSLDSLLVNDVNINYYIKHLIITLHLVTDGKEVEYEVLNLDSKQDYSFITLRDVLLNGVFDDYLSEMCNADSKTLKVKYMFADGVSMLTKNLWLKHEVDYDIYIGTNYYSLFSPPSLTYLFYRIVDSVYRDRYFNKLLLDIAEITEIIDNELRDTTVLKLLKSRLIEKQKEILREHNTTLEDYHNRLTRILLDKFSKGDFYSFNILTMEGLLDNEPKKYEVDLDDDCDTDDGIINDSETIDNPNDKWFIIGVVGLFIFTILYSIYQ